MFTKSQALRKPKKPLTVYGYLIKQGATKGAWYERRG